MKYELRLMNNLTKEHELINTFDYETLAMMDYVRYIDRAKPGYRYIIMTIDDGGNRKPFEKYGHSFCPSWLK